jgi:hypothetical protein
MCFGPAPGNVDADLFHDGDGLRANSAGLGASVFDLEALAGIVARKAFSQLTSRGLRAEFPVLSETYKGPLDVWRWRLKPRH